MTNLITCKNLKGGNSLELGVGSCEFLSGGRVSSRAAGGRSSSWRIGSWGLCIKFLFLIVLDFVLVADANAENLDSVVENTVAFKRYPIVPYPRELIPVKGECSADVKPDFIRVPGIPAEGYELSISPGRVLVRASDAAGEFYARQTLLQLSDGKTIPCCEIKDSPRFKWRGIQVPRRDPPRCDGRAKY